MSALAATAVGPDLDPRGHAEDPIFKGRFAIRLSAPLPDMSSPAGSAYKVEDTRGEEGALFAVVSSPNLPVRIEEIEALRGFADPHVLRLVSAGEVAMAPGGPLDPVVIYDYPAGGSAMAGGKLRALRDHEVRGAVVAPLCRALHALHKLRVSHRAIRPDNLFFADERRSHLVVGDCLSGLPGQCQPVAFEPIERAFAPPTGRGAGGPEADMYAFGATVLAFLLGQTPCAGLANEEVLQARIERGSLAALCGERRFSPDMETLLGALLADRVALRWGIAEVRQWLNGQSVPHKILRSERASQPFTLEDRKYWTARGVADALNRNWDAAVPAIRSEALESWLTRHLDAPSMADSIAARRGEAGGSVYNKKIGTDEMVSRCCIALDPDGPIRYRGTSVAFDGVGGLLANAMAESNEELAQTVAAIIEKSLPSAWIEAKAERRTAAAHMMATYIRFARYIGNALPGFGIERCLYELNPGLRCLSPVLQSHPGRDIGSILKTINSSDRSKEGGGEWFDRHVAAFMAVALHPKFDSRLAEASMPSDPATRRTLTALVLFSMAQHEAGAPAMVNLARSMHKPISDIVNGFHSRSFRKAVGSDLDHFVKQGDIAAMERLIVDHRVQRRDQEGYRQAVGRYLGAEQEIQRVRVDEGARRATRAIAVGRRLAARISYAALVATITLIAMSYAG